MKYERKGIEIPLNESWNRFTAKYYCRPWSNA